MKQGILKSALLASVSLAALGGGAQAPVLAQDQDRVIEEIIVVSRRREESLRDVPATVSVLTESTLEAAGVQRAEDFLRMTPGVTIVDAAEVGDTQVNIRGINGARDAENSFAFIVDGILMTNPAAFNREFADLQQIEILKGPQGAIYGRNAAAGAVIVSTRKPGNDFTADATVSYGTHETLYGSATLSGPLVTDELFFSAHFDYRDTDGFYFNEFTNEEGTVDQFQNYNVTGRVLWQPDDRTALDVKARYGEVDGSAIVFNAAFSLENFAAAFANPAAFEDVNAHPFRFQQNINSDNDQQALELSAKLDHDLGWADLTAWMLYSDIDNDFISDGTSGAFGFFSSNAGVTDQAGTDAFNACQTSTSDLFNGGAGAFSVLPPPGFLGATPIPILVHPTPFDANGVPQGSFFGPYTPTTCDGLQEQLRLQSDFSLEVRLASHSDQAMRWEVGAYFLNIDREVGVSLNTDTGNTPVRGLFQRSSDSGNFTEALLWDKFDSTVFALFGNVSYDFTEDIEVTLALRYDNEKRKVTNLVPTNVVTQFVDFDGDFVPGGSPLNPALLSFPGGVPPQSKTFSEFEPKISASWDVSDTLTLYASWGKGFKSGGFNNVGSQATIDSAINGFIGLIDPTFVGPQIEDIFEEETSSAFEAGFKGSAMGGRLSFDGAFYYVDVTNMQSFEFFVGPFGLLRVVNNIDKVRLKGFEFGANAQLHEYFSVSGGVNVIDSEIRAFTSRPNTIGNKSPYTADYTVNASAEFNYPVYNDISFFARADALWVGDTWFHSIQDETVQTLNGPLIELFFCPALGGFPGCDAGLGLANFSNTKRDAYMTVDLRFGLETESWSLVGFAKNVTKEVYLEEVIPAPEFGGSFIHPAALRTWGLELSFRY